MRILKTLSSDTKLHQLRGEYLRALYEPQDMYSESLVKAGDAYLLFRDDVLLGYVVMAEPELLVEFYVREARGAQIVFDELRQRLGIRRALCKTYDAMLLSLAMGGAVQSKVIAHLFTDSAETGFQPRAEIVTRLARAPDIAAIWAINDDFFDSEAEIADYINRAQLTVYEDASGLIGCGLCQPVIGGRDDMDIGMIVNPARRRQGYGNSIVRHLKADCLARGLRPICCASVDNLASHACLEAAGFRSRHRTIEFQF